MSEQATYTRPNFTSQTRCQEYFPDTCHKITSSWASPPWSFRAGASFLWAYLDLRLMYEKQDLTNLFKNHFILLRKIKLSNPGRKTHSCCQLWGNSRQFYFASLLHLLFIDIFDVCPFPISQGSTITTELEEILIHNCWHEKMPLL